MIAGVPSIVCTRFRVDRILEERGHRAVGLDVLRVDRLAVIRVGDEDAPEARLEVGEILRKAEDRHDLARDRDDEAVLARDAVDLAAEADDDVAQRAVVHVDAALHKDAALVDAERVALLHVVVQHRAEQIVRRGDRVHVAREVQVDVLHRQDLRVAAAGRRRP